MVRSSCWNCKRFLHTTKMSQHILCMLRLIDADLWEKLEGLQQVYSENFESKSQDKVTELLHEYVDTVIRGESGIMLKSLFGLQLYEFPITHYFRD